MTYDIIVSTLDGKEHLFTNVESSLSIKDFKKEVYWNHPHINKPFQKNEIDNIHIDLSLEGIKLDDYKLLDNINIQNKTLIVSIRSKSIQISKKKTVFDNYKVSPCSGPDDVFLDTYEEHYKQDRSLIMDDIYSKLAKIEGLFNDIKNKLELLES